MAAMERCHVRNHVEINYFKIKGLPGFLALALRAGQARESVLQDTNAADLNFPQCMRSNRKAALESSACWCP